MQCIQSLVSSLEIGNPQVFGDLSLFPLRHGAGKEMDYVLLDEALEQKLAHVTEVSQAGHVPELAFENDSTRRVLLVDGDELLGARQNRIVNITILVGAGRKLVIPVSCVEQGRWSYRSAKFEAARRSLFASAKAAKMRNVSDSLKQRGDRRSNQSQVWEAIQCKLADRNVESGTASMNDLYSTIEKDLGGYEQAFRLEPSQAGGVFAIGGKVLGVEIFDAPEAFARSFPKIIRSYAMEARDSAAKDESKAALEDVHRFLDEMLAAATEKYAALGEGEDVRLSAKDLAGGALVAEGRVVHLAAYRVEQGAGV